MKKYYQIKELIKKNLMKKLKDGQKKKQNYMKILLKNIQI